MQRPSWAWWLVIGLAAIALAGTGVAVEHAIFSPIVRKIAEAIAHAEGFDVPNSLPQRQNNPGDISDAEGVLYFPDAESGWQALYHQVSLMFSGGSRYYNPSMTIEEVAKKYAQDWQPWAANVADFLGVTTGTKLSEIV